MTGTHLNLNQGQTRIEDEDKVNVRVNWCSVESRVKPCSCSTSGFWIGLNLL
jgi:hypothetical protein